MRSGHGDDGLDSPFDWSRRGEKHRLGDDASDGVAYQDHRLGLGRSSLVQGQDAVDGPDDKAVLVDQHRPGHGRQLFVKVHREKVEASAVLGVQLQGFAQGHGRQGTDLSNKV